MKRSSLKPKQKERKCLVCKGKFLPWNTIQPVCGPKCALDLIYGDKEKETEKKRLEFNRETKRRKEAAKSKTKLMLELQPIFNKYVRIRDAGLPCISCGRYDPEIVDRFVGGKWDCGHYLTRGAHPELRVNLKNAHKQCKSCNGGSGQFSGKNRTVQEAYKVNLIEKIGQDNVDWLEGPHQPLKYDADYIRRFKKIFRLKTRRLEYRRTK